MRGEAHAQARFAVLVHAKASGAMGSDLSAPHPQTMAPKNLGMRGARYKVPRRVEQAEKAASGPTCSYETGTVTETQVSSPNPLGCGRPGSGQDARSSGGKKQQSTLELPSAQPASPEEAR